MNPVYTSEEANDPQPLTFTACTICIDGCDGRCNDLVSLSDCKSPAQRAATSEKEQVLSPEEIPCCDICDAPATWSRNTFLYCDLHKPMAACDRLVTTTPACAYDGMHTGNGSGICTYCRQPLGSPVPKLQVAIESAVGPDSNVSVDLETGGGRDA